MTHRAGTAGLCGYCRRCGHIFDLELAGCPRCGSCPQCGQREQSGQPHCKGCRHPLDVERFQELAQELAVESPSNQRRIAVLEQDWQDGRLLKKLDENRLLWFVHLPLAYLSHGFIRQLAGGDWRLALFVTMLLVGVAYVLRLPQLFVTLVRRGYLRFLLRRGESL